MAFAKMQVREARYRCNRSDRASGAVSERIGLLRDFTSGMCAFLRTRPVDPSSRKAVVVNFTFSGNKLQRTIKVSLS